MASLRSRLFFRLFPPPRAPCRFLRIIGRSVRVPFCCILVITPVRQSTISMWTPSAAILMRLRACPVPSNCQRKQVPPLALLTMRRLLRPAVPHLISKILPWTTLTVRLFVARTLLLRMLLLRSWLGLKSSMPGVLHAANPDTYASHFRARAAFQMFLPASFASAASPAPAALHASMLPELLAAEKDWAALVAALEPCNPPDVDVSALPLSGAAVAAPTPLDTVAQWLTAGRCNQADGALNIKQAAMLALRASWLQDLHIHALSGLSTAPPAQLSILLGGPGTGKSYVLRLLQTLNELYLPRAPLVRGL